MHEAAATPSPACGGGLGWGRARRFRQRVAWPNVGPRWSLGSRQGGLRSAGTTRDLASTFRGTARRAAVALETAQAHRLQHVLRLAPGTTIAAFNADDGEWLCRIAELGRGRGLLNVVEQRRAPEPGADVWLLFAPIKRAPA